MKNIALLVLIIAFAICSQFWIYNKNTKECEQFALNRNASVLSIERHYTIFGTPYMWMNKSTAIWEIKLSNGETWYMRPMIYSTNEFQK